VHLLLMAQSDTDCSNDALGGAHQRGPWLGVESASTPTSPYAATSHGMENAARKELRNKSKLAERLTKRSRSRWSRTR
jgi:hypothetical protein